jgi:hypothetical protein
MLEPALLLPDLHERPRYLLSKRIARSSPSSVIGNIRLFMICRITAIDCRTWLRIGRLRVSELAGSTKLTAVQDLRLQGSAHRILVEPTELDARRTLSEAALDLNSS